MNIDTNYTMITGAHHKILLTCIIHLSIIQLAQAQLFRQMSLVEVDSIDVVINVDNESELSSFAQTLKNRTELRLRQNDIRIGLDENITTLTFSVLVLDIGFTGESPVGKAARYDLELSKLLSTETQLLPSVAITWQAGGIITTSKDNLETEIKNLLDESLDTFLNDYLETKQEFNR